MALQTPERDGTADPEGSIFLAETSQDLARHELKLWLGRGAWAGTSLEQRITGQRDIEVQRHRLNGSAALGHVEVI